MLSPSFKEIYDIPSRFKTQKTRFVLGIENKEKNNFKGDFFLITEGKMLDKFFWNKSDKNNK